MKKNGSYLVGVVIGEIIFIMLIKQMWSGATKNNMTEFRLMHRQAVFCIATVVNLIVNAIIKKIQYKKDLQRLMQEDDEEE